MQILSGRRHRVAELAFSPCGRWLAAGGRGGLHLWDTHDPGAGPRHVPDRPKYSRFGGLAFRPDGRLFYTANLSWYLVDPGAAPARVAGQRYGSYAFSPDATRAVRAAGWNPLRTYRIGDGVVTAGPTVSAARTYFGHAAFTPDGTTFAVEEVVPFGQPSPVRVGLRAAETGKPTAALPGWAAPGRSPSGTRYRFSPDGSRLVGRWRAELACWAVADPDRPPVVAANPAGRDFLWLAFHPGGSLLTVDDGRAVRVWDAGTLTPGRAIEWNVGKLYAVAVSPDGTRAAVGSHTGKVLVWDWD